MCRDWRVGFFFSSRRRHTRCGRDWSSDVCSSDLIAGAGNVWKSEICFLRGVSPWTPAGQVDDLEGMLALLKRMMETNRTIGYQVTTGDTRRGRRHWVAERTGEPCLRCGTPIRQAGQPAGGFERLTYWCPSCQRGPTAAPAAKAQGGDGQGADRQSAGRAARDSGEPAV